MFHLGVPTTRALAVTAGNEGVRRPWYKEQTPEELEAIAARVRLDSSIHPDSYRHGGDVLIWEQAAMTTRVATSFIRVGTFELYARRAVRGGGGHGRGGDDTSMDGDTAAVGMRQLEMLTKHTLAREYREINRTAPLQQQTLTMMEEGATRFGGLTCFELDHVSLLDL